MQTRANPDFIQLTSNLFTALPYSNNAMGEPSFQPLDQYRHIRRADYELNRNLKPYQLAHQLTFFTRINTPNHTEPDLCPCSRLVEGIQDNNLKRASDPPLTRLVRSIFLRESSI